MPAPKLTAEEAKKLVQRLAKRLGGRAPPALVQQLVNNPALVRALLDELAVLVGGSMKEVQAGRKQIIFLGNTGPNNAKEWVIVKYRNGPNGNGEKVWKVTPRLGIEPALDGTGKESFYGDVRSLALYLKQVRSKLSRPGVVLMNKISAATQFSPYGSPGGKYFGRRASDSKVVSMKPAEAEKVADRPAAKSSADWLLVWWVPPEYAKEAVSRIKSGWVDPIWDWGRGRLVKKGQDVVKASVQDKRQILATLLRAGRRDLAEAVAKTL